MSHTSSSTPTKDDIVILYNLYERQSELQKIINDDQTSTDHKLQAELELAEIAAKIEAKTANTFWPKMVVSSSNNSPSKKINQPSNPFSNVGTSSLTSSGGQKKSVIKLSDIAQQHTNISTSNMTMV
jgi:hypothetical protein